MPNLYPHDETGVAIQEHGLNASPLQVITLPLGIAKTKEDISIGGSFLWAYYATSLSANVQIQINSLKNDPVLFRKGMMIRGVKFNRIFITNTAQAGEEITFIYAQESIEGIQVENAAIDFTDVYLVNPTDLQTFQDVVIAAGTRETVLAANSSRKAAYIRSLDTNPIGLLRVGDVNCAAARGYPLAPGDSINLETTDIIYAWNAHSTDPATVTGCYEVK